MRAPRQPKRKPLPPPVALTAGARVGRYVVRNLLGTGSYGIVYRAWDEAAEDDVALKEYLPRSLALRSGAAAVVPRSDEAAAVFAAGLRRFSDDARAFARLDHPSLVKVYEVVEQNGTAYQVMAFVTGRSLAVAQQARGRPPREATLRALFDPLFDAVAALHGAGLVHGDITPQSILVEPNGNPVLLEMASVRPVLAAASGIGAPGSREGYVAPELLALAHAAGDGDWAATAPGAEPTAAAGEAATSPRAAAAPREAAAGPWSDVYALGAVLHFVITGKAPAPAADRYPGDRLALRAQHHEPRYSVELLAVVDWMLAPQPAERPQGIAAVRAALADGEVPKPFAPPRRRRWRGRIRRHRVALVVGAVALLAIGAAAATLWILADSGRIVWPPPWREWLSQLPWPKRP